MRNLSPAAFLSSGMIPDPLMGIIQKAINSAKGLPPSAMKEIVADREKIVEALLLFDRVLTYCAVEPKIQMPPPCTDCGEYLTAKHANDHQYHEGERDPNVLYADQVVMDDKTFVFQWALGGTKDIQSFRSEQAANVASLSDGQGVQRASKRTARSKR
jgi:hypothetical protein